MSDKRLAKIESFAVTWLLVFMMLGYPFVALIPTLLDKASSFASIPYRIIILAIAFLMLVFQCMRETSEWRINAFFKLFITLYLFRLIFDLLYYNIPNASHALLFFIVVCMIPALAIGKVGPNVLNEYKLAIRLILVGTLICGVAVLTCLLDLGFNRSLLMTTGRLSFEALNPISLGYAATTTLVTFVWFNTRQCWPVRRLATVSIVAVPALLCLFLASSRGPILAFEISMLWLFLTNPRVSSRIYIVLFMAIVLCFISFCGKLDVYGYLHTHSYWFTHGSWHVNNNMHDRFVYFLDDESVFDRIALLKQAVGIFVRSPWIGGAYVDYNSYPHNILLEAAMSLGVVGFGILIALLMKTTSYLNLRFDQSKSLITVLFIEYFINSQLSSSLWGMAEFWTLLVLMTVQPNQSVKIAIKLPLLMAKAE